MIGAASDIAEHKEEWISKYYGIIPGDWVYKLYANHGLKMELIEELASLYGLGVDKQGFLHTFLEARERDMRVSQVKLHSVMGGINEKVVKIITASGLPLTDDSAKYVYEASDGHYYFPTIETEILLLIQDERQVSKVTGGSVGVVLKNTNFYYEAGGQMGDIGLLCATNADVNILSVDNVGGYIVHWGAVEDGELAVGDTVLASICPERRVKCMQHHTATHLLNCAINYVTGK